MLYFLSAISGALFAAALFMLARNEWVFRNRIRILRNSRWDGRSHIEYDSLPSYDTMVLQFWNWNADSFIGRGK